MAMVFCGTENNFKFCPMCGNLLVIGNLDGQQRPFCEKCGWIHYLNPPPVVCGLCYRRVDLGVIEVLLIKRAVEPKKGFWSLPGGFIEIGESPEQACLRELEEETGIGGLKGVCIISAEYQRSRRYGSVVVIGYAVEIKGNPPLKAGDDAQEVKWFPVNKRPQMPFHSFETMFRKWQRNCQTTE